MPIRIAKAFSNLRRQSIECIGRERAGARRPRDLYATIDGAGHRLEHALERYKGKMLRGGRYPSSVQGMVIAVHHAQQEQSNSGNQRDRSQGRSQDLIEIRHDLWPALSGEQRSQTPSRPGGAQGSVRAHCGNAPILGLRYRD